MWIGLWIMWICQKISKFFSFLKLQFIVISFLVFISAVGLHIVVPSVSAETMPDHRHLTIVVVPGLSFQEIDWFIRHGERDWLWGKGGFAAMNVKPDGQYSYLNNMVSISTGKRAQGVQGWNAYEHHEEIEGGRAGDIVTQWYGEVPNSDLVHPHFHLLVDKDSESNYSPHSGHFGEILKNNDVYRYTIGHADTRHEQARYASLLTIDKSGEANGMTFGFMKNDRHFPTGERIDTKRLVDKIVNIQKSYPQTFIVIEWGDLFRLTEEQSYMTNEAFNNQYKKTLLSLERTLREAYEQTLGEVWLVSPFVHNEAYQHKNQLSPLWIWGEEENQYDSIYSNTTRRSGLISHTDLTVTWAEYFDVDKSEIDTAGSPLKLFTHSESRPNYTSFKERLEEINHVFTGRAKVLSSYVSGLVIMLIAASLMIWLMEKNVSWRERTEILLLSGVLSPLWFLVTSFIGVQLSAMGYVLFITLGSVVSALLLKKFVPMPFSAACFLFFLALSIDLLTGYHMIQRSFLGYDPVIGARYYGIGNEFAGIYIASGLFMVYPLLDHFRKTQHEQSYQRNSLILFMTVIFTMIIFLAHGSLGANAGASLSVGIVLLFFMYHRYFKKRSLWIIAGVAFVGGILLLLLLFLLQFGQSDTHISRAFSQLFSGDITEILNIIERKIEMNWKIFRVSYWSQLFITSYFLIGVMLWKTRQVALCKDQALLGHLGIVASIALLLLNDSGIIAAATSMFITLCISYGWSIQSKKFVRTDQVISDK